MQRLRKLISLIVEDAYQLKKWAEESGDANEKMLASMGITPVPHGKKSTSYLDKGAFASVYEVVYWGRRAVAKITSSEDDYISYKRVFEMQSRLPPEVAKHLPKIYAIKTTQGKLYLGAIHETTFYVIVTEFLELMTHDLRTAYFYVLDKKDADRNGEMLLKDTNRFKQLIKAAWPTVKMTSNLYAKIFDPLNAPKWQEIFANVKDVEDRRTYDRIVNLIGTDAMKEHNIQSGDIHELMYVLGRAVGGRRFPRSVGGDYQELIDQVKDPRIVSFMKALRYLATNENFKWDDAHSKNVMVRPRTGDLVMADVGLFFSARLT